ncbi:MAG: beta galactosidase jelly roll domain-containing protein, partial [Calditrichaceae bacterium]
MKIQFRLFNSNVLLLLAILSLMPTFALSQSRMTELFTNGWHFKPGDVENGQDQSLDDSKWRLLDLPHDWSIEGKINPENPMGGAGGYFSAGVGWYRKTFDVPNAWTGKRVSIYFGGVYMKSEVFINGKSLGLHPYGYTSFSYDLTPYLDFN